MLFRSYMEHTNLQTQSILIVDDVEANRFILRNIIIEMGFRPVLAENGVQALKILPQCSPKLILLDIAMPKMDGYEFCKLLKDNPNTREIPIIFISAFDAGEDIVRGFEMGCEDYITKPFIGEVIKARINVHLKFAETTKNLSEMNRHLQASVDEQLAQMEQEKKSVLYALAHVAGENSCYEQTHIQRLKYNCRLLAQAMQLSEVYGQQISDTYVDTIELAAPLCDVGNMAVPTEVLQKQDMLTGDELEQMKRHTVIGAKMLEEISGKSDYNDYVQMAVDIAHYHHENWDGSGYPQGLAGKDIPLAAQIVSLIGACNDADRGRKKIQSRYICDL